MLYDYDSKSSCLLFYCEFSKNSMLSALLRFSVRFWFVLI